MPNQVNYDAIASTYNRRFTDQSRSGTLVALEALIQASSAIQVLEVGCGTGHWLERLRSLARSVYGLDFSAGMLAQANQRGKGLSLIQARAEELPFLSGWFNLVYCVNAIHHFQRQRDFIHQACRILKPGGALAVLGMAPHHHRDDWYVYEFFEGTYETDLARFPSWKQVSGWMSAAGFVNIELQLAEEIIAPKYGFAVLGDPFLAKNSCSQLALLSDQEYAAGLDRIRQALAEADAQGKTVVFRDTIQIHQMVGWVM
jgi:SAM-dependent methyltransferase